ncbi:hypothetical protein [Bradyrhizobium sp.]|uniref:hypothetical protein n=1 Tax=Bradyrhizobium sp. TaxID=376 RepID=UPI003C60EED9
MLTPEDGILIFCKDQERGWFLMVLRVFAWLMATGGGLADLLSKFAFDHVGTWGPLPCSCWSPG